MKFLENMNQFDDDDSKLKLTKRSEIKCRIVSYRIDC